MSRRFSLLILIPILLGSACGSINLSSASALKSVYVSPSSGSGSFDATVSYVWSPADQNFTITCTYPDPDGYSMTAPIPIPQDAIESYFKISVTKPGHYSINCEDSLNHSASAGFTVTGEPGPTSEATKTFQFTNARISFNGDKILFDTTPVGGATASWLEGYCWPPVDYENNGKSYFTVAKDGTLDGRCSVDTQSDHILGEVTGHYDKESGAVSFHLTAGHTWTPVGDEANGHVAAVVFDGSGQLNGDVASGTANFTVTCNANGNSTCVHDFDIQDLKYTGTIPFTITFLP